jgi:hypothetical protein
MPENVPQTERPGFDEFLKLKCVASDFVDVRTWTMRSAAMRRDLRSAISANGLFFGAFSEGMSSSDIRRPQGRARSALENRYDLASMGRS